MHWEPSTRLATHNVTNQPKLFGGLNTFDADPCLRGILGKALSDDQLAHLRQFGQQIGAHETQELVDEANKNPPVLKSFDRFGQRLDEVTFHPAYHALMDLGLSAGIASKGWTEPNGHTMHSAIMYLSAGADVGVCCPMSMTYAGIPVLRKHAAGQPWAEKALAGGYDKRFLPMGQKSAVTLGMAMTEKQGGSDVRANTTRAEKTADGWRLTGHKWFCSAPMSDAFLTLAQTEKGLSCFLVPRWRPDVGDAYARNEMHIMRLKDKMGDRSNASSEIEYHGAYAELLGDEGAGIRTIIEMVQHTRLDCAVISAGSMRTTLARAIWHVSHRSAFQKRLIDQPAMRRVLADLALEAEAATALSMRLARAFDNGDDAQEAAFARIATPIAKYWICKRQPGFVYEALECFGGVGFVEEHAMARYFRTSPLNAIWEGSGNVIALDILRAMARSPESVEAAMSWLKQAAGRNAAYDAHLGRLSPTSLSEASARRFAEDAGLAMAARALCDHAPEPVFDAFCAARLDPEARSLNYGAYEGAIDEDTLIARAFVAPD